MENRYEWDLYCHPGEEAQKPSLPCSPKRSAGFGSQTIGAQDLRRFALAAASPPPRARRQHRSLERWSVDEVPADALLAWRDSLCQRAAWHNLADSMKEPFDFTSPSSRVNAAALTDEFPWEHRSSGAMDERGAVESKGAIRPSIYVL